MSTLAISYDNILPGVALAWARAGYSVIPLVPRTKKRRTRQGTQPTTDERRVRTWWARWPDANIGLALNDLPVVVIDIDGPIGEASLAWLLSAAGLDSLPATFTVGTGRDDGGRHAWFRLPVGAVKLVNQLGHNEPTTPNLDALFQGLVLAPGSMHRSGLLYIASQPEVPELAHLTELPIRFYDVLADRGRPKLAGATSPGSKAPVSRPGPRAPVLSLTPGTHPSELPNGLRAMLADTSDGRNGRTLKVVSRLAWLGLGDEAIIKMVLAFPLGLKAHEQSNPKAWLQEKIDTARRYNPPKLAKDDFWWSAHTSGMSSAKIRILDVLLRHSSAWGNVTRSLGWIGIDAATASPAKAIEDLIREGWLVRVIKGDQDHAATYRLQLPGAGDVNYHPQIGRTPSPPPPLQWDLCVVFRAALPGDDAFRCRAGSLSAAYPLLTLLGPEPQPLGHLAAMLKVTLRALEDRASALVRAGVAVEGDQGLSLTTEPLMPLLTAAAERAGTGGRRRQAIANYYEKAEEFRRRRAEAAIVGTSMWLRLRNRRYLRRAQRGLYDDLVHHYGTHEAVASALAELEAQALLRPHPLILPPAYLGAASLATG